MKTLRQLCVVFVLTLMLALSAFAGQIDTGFTDPLPPPESRATTTGDISTSVMGDISTGVTATDSVTTVALNLLQSLLPLF